MNVTVTEAIDEYLASRAASGLKPRSLGCYRAALRFLRDTAGDTQVRNLTGRHIDIALTVAGRTRQAGAMNTVHTSLRQFVAFCHGRSYLPKSKDPMAGVKARKVPRKEQYRVAVTDFPRLLDAAPNPRDRIVVALGLYLLLRQSEIATLRIGDVNLAAGTVHVQVHKSDLEDDMPISSELDSELRRYLTWYSRSHSLDPNFFLVPARGTAWALNDSGKFMSYESDGIIIRPTRQSGQLQTCAQRALEAIGVPTRDEDGRSRRMGVHTLRRSAARAWFDFLVDDRTTDGALLQVAAMLHHQDVKVTQRYIGLEPERRKRDIAVKGKLMFPQVAPSATLRVVNFGGSSDGDDHEVVAHV